MNVLIVDSHILFREGLHGLLSKEMGFTVVGQAGCDQEAVERTVALSPELVLLDLDLPRQGGLSALEALVAAQPAAAIVILSAHEQNDGLFDAMRLGAIGYLPKDTPFCSLVAALRGIAQGELALSRCAMRQLLEAYRSLEQHFRLAADTLPSLTTREIQVLNLISAGYCNRGIAQELVISEHTVKVHVHNILDKLHLPNRAQAAGLARLVRLDGSPHHLPSA